MGYLVIISIIILYFYLDKLLTKKCNIPKRNWVYKPESKWFAILFFLTFIAYVFIVFIYSDANFFFIFPFIGATVKLIFSAEQFIYKRENRLFITYLLEAFLWVLLGITAIIFFN
ncbi:hypothetical protein GCM10011351_00210 [Paraliobacillus quinghaiensis]|uniref:DUF4181 domain-containing protein n=1 Tax=Paraliobacillus quinghaiensis TaxID=470815 RepID=A0A917WP92_9BACI|nr:DUF4181 domain-containing protein [Paraliobacillus quinghaiensis]GGM18371.1 hypothetical protein GCM10011351_00210 [Paraliobacillus quinghaiensis]